MRVIALATLLLVAGCGAAATHVVTAPASPKPASQIDQLRRDLGAIFNANDVEHATWAVAVKSLKTDEVLFAMNSNKLLTPASNQKIITAAVAADRLGWDYRYSTKIYATSAIDNGVIHGDLVVVSNGDPSINPRHPLRWTVFHDWAQQLHDKGVRSITGRLIGDDNAFAEPGWGVGWAWDDLLVDFGAPVGGLQYNENAVRLVILPEFETGLRAQLSLEPEGSSLAIQNNVVMVAAGQPPHISLARPPGSNILQVSGQLPLGAARINADVAVVNPTVFFLGALQAALADAGISVSAGPLDIDDEPSPPTLATATLLLEDRSPPLTEIIDANMKWSLNEYSETLLRSIAAMPTEATAEAGLQKVAETLMQWGVAKDLYITRDGSGLSRNDYLAPDALIAVLTHVWKDDRLRAPFESTLPQAAVSGTLANRLKNTVAAERVWAKTGSMSNVRSLSGYAMTLDNEPIVFSFMTTGFTVPASRIDAAMDEALVRLVKFPRELHEEH